MVYGYCQAGQAGLQTGETIQIPVGWWVGELVGGWSSPILQAYLTVSWSQVRVSQSQSSVAITVGDIYPLLR